MIRAKLLYLFCTLLMALSLIYLMVDLQSAIATSSSLGREISFRSSFPWKETRNLVHGQESERGLSSPIMALSRNIGRKEGAKSEVEKIHYSGGYVLAHDFWEQLTSGSRNLFTMQCWASRLNLSVVEPFVKKSDFYSPASNRDVKDMLRFSDVFDMNHWNMLSKGARYSPLTSWENFIERAPRNLITVNVKYGATQQISQQESRLYREGCGSRVPWKNLVQFLQSKHNFTVVRKVCINFSNGKMFSFSAFNKEVFGDDSPVESTVLFGQWRGLSVGRMQVRETGCSDKTAAIFDAEPSKRILLDAQKYTEKYLKTRNYVAIFARMEKAKQQKKQKGIVSTCFHETLNHWSKMASDAGLNTTFLSADVGRFGSSSFTKAKDDLDTAFTEFFTSIYRDKLTIQQWESTFESTSGTSQSGYIGVLQKVVASNAKCVLFVGGGSFQRNALELYMKKHDKEDRCIDIVENCTEAKLKHVI